MSFYDNFVSLCAERQISPSAVAQKAGLDKSIVSYWKKHDNVIPKFENLQKIAAVFEVSIPHLLLGHDPKKREEKTEEKTYEQIEEEVEQELEDYIERKDPKSARLARFLANNPEFVSYLSKIGFEFKIDQDNIIWAWYKKTYDYEISIEGLGISGITDTKLY